MVLRRNPSTIIEGLNSMYSTWGYYNDRDSIHIIVMCFESLYYSNSKLSTYYYVYCVVQYLCDSAIIHVWYTIHVHV